MLTFLFEQYGYYPKEFDNNEFMIDNWKFKLIEVDYNDDYIEKVYEYINVIRNNFYGKGPFIINTRFNKKISVYDNKKYVLISVNEENMSLKDLNKFHCVFVEEDKRLDLKKVLKMWEQRISQVESEAINSLRVDSVYYKNNVEITMFSLGLAQNALQYLSDVVLDYGENLNDLTIVHKRLKNLDSFDFFNPFNFIVDHPIKDLVELYRNDFLSFVDLLEILKYYKLDSKIASVFMARILYPVNVLDMLEENNNKKDVSFNIHLNIEKELQKLKKIYLYLKKEYNIRPMNWLEN